MTNPYGRTQAHARGNFGPTSTRLTQNGMWSCFVTLTQSERMKVGDLGEKSKRHSKQPLTLCCTGSSGKLEQVQVFG